jgi:hypothetical protein
MDPTIDGAHVPAPLAVDQGESSWLCAELAGPGPHGVRRFAVLAWLHRTGPRLNRLASGPGALDHNQLPAALRDIVPRWLPIITPVRIESDDRPLLMVVLYDLDAPDAPPIQVEREVEHASFDASSFSAATSEVAVRVLADRIVIEARTRELALCLEARPTKRAAIFGDGTPILRHGDIEIGYVQRSRLAVEGVVSLRGERVDVTGAGAHDRHWRRATVTNLAWLWLHLRLPGEREVNCYALRDAVTNMPIARRGWWIDAEGDVHSIEEPVLAADGDAYVFAAPTLDIRIRFVHAVARPYLRMRAFGEAIDGGIAEAPIRVCDQTESPIEGWLEVFDARRCAIR